MKITSNFKVPLLEYPDVDSVKTALNRLNNDKNTLFNRTVDAITEAHERNLTNIDLFKVELKNKTSFLMRCPKNEWEEFLDRANVWFESVEEYERCSQILKLKNELNLN